MTTVYRAPTSETLFVLTEVLGLGEAAGVPGFADVPVDVLSEVLKQAAVFAERVLHPLNADGDAIGCTWDGDGTVRTPPGFREAYARFVEGGWPSLDGPVQYGGNGLPRTLAVACQEYVWAANCSFGMYASQIGNAKLLLSHGTQSQIDVYVPNLVSGRWSGAMGLTEAQAGTDLGLVRTVAVPRDTTAGSYELRGTKVFTSGGEHDLTENIVNFVLARIPGGPPGTRGLSLFLVPKYLPDESGRPGERNRVVCAGIEHKMGLRASATCVMDYDGATGFLVGEPHAGLAAMFSLMNHTRVVTAVQALGVSDIAYQNAAAYARQRPQGRSPSGPRHPDAPADPIIVQPDVRRLLLSIRSFNEAARALVLWVALQSDLSETSRDPGQRQRAAEQLALFTPVLKGMLGESGFENAVAAQHVFGGYGYVSETGVDQFVRDVRVSAIGEGVTAVHAMDLVRRKLPLSGGAPMRTFVQEVHAAIAGHDEHTTPGCAGPMQLAVSDLEQATEWISARQAQAPDDVAAAAVHYLHLVGRVALGWMWLRTLAAVDRTSQRDATVARGKPVLARFFVQNLPADTHRRLSHIQTGSATVMALPDEFF